MQTPTPLLVTDGGWLVVSTLHEDDVLPEISQIQTKPRGENEDRTARQLHVTVGTLRISRRQEGFGET